jgi:fructokinase
VRIGIDLGGTKIEVIALGDHGEVLARQRVPTPQGDYRATLQAVMQLVESVEQTTGQSGSVGVATPGAISALNGLIKNANSVCLNGQPLHADLQELLRRPVRIANDANCFALSEAGDGAAAGMRVVFGVIIGTGTGGGIVVDGKPLIGPNAIAGEWGHNPLPWPQADELPGPACYCGKRACIETYLSGPGITRDHQGRGGAAITAQEIVVLAEQGDDAAEATLKRYEDRLARALASVINILDPDAVILGGGLSQIERLYRNVPVLLPRYVFSDQVATKLLPPKHGDSSGVRGAAWLWSAP